MKTVLDMFSVFVRYKVIVNKKVSITNHASGIRLSDCPKLAINQKNDSRVTICQNGALSISFEVVASK